MPKKVILLRPFVFSSPPRGNERLTREQKFTPQKDPQTGQWIPTEIELEDHVAGHEWISEHYADGCIERPEVTAKRVEEVEARKKKQAEDNALQLAKAENAMVRAGAVTPIKINDEEVEKELNTPVNQLKGKRGSGIDTPVNRQSA